MRFLVTGATGFLGGTVVRRLTADGVDAVATGRNLEALGALPVPSDARFEWDMSKPLTPARLEKLKDVTAILHCAALSSAWGALRAFEAANIDGTAHALSVAKHLGIRHFIHISTPAVYFRFEDQLNVAETTPLPKPVNAYAQTKSASEDLVRQSGVPYTILRPRGIYGRGDTALLPRLLRAAKAGPLPRFRGGAACTDITHVNDISAAIIATLGAADAAKSQVFNVSGGEALPLQSIAEKACAAVGQHIRWRDLPIGPTLAAVRANEWFARLRGQDKEPRITAYGLGIFAFSQTLDISRARKVLNWEPKVPFEEGLARTFETSPGGKP